MAGEDEDDSLADLPAEVIGAPEREKQEEKIADEGGPGETLQD